MVGLGTNQQGRHPELGLLIEDYPRTGGMHPQCYYVQYVPLALKPDPVGTQPFFILFSWTGRYGRFLSAINLHSFCMLFCGHFIAAIILERSVTFLLYYRDKILVSFGPLLSNCIIIEQMENFSVASGCQWLYVTQPVFFSPHIPHHLPITKQGFICEVQCELVESELSGHV